MSFIQITDTHFVPGDALLYGTSPKKRLAQAVDLIRRFHGDAEAVLLTGDLAHHGEEGAYETLKEVLAPLDMPVFLMMGNHDSRAPFRKVFPDMPESDGGFVQFAFDVAGARVICLDSLNDEPGDHEGRLCDKRLSWLDRELGKAPSDKPVILAVHHPPFDLGIPAMDKIKLRDGAALFEVLQKRRPDQMLFGHVHRPIAGHWRGIPFYLQRAVNHQVYLNFEARDEVEFVEENPDIGIVRVSEDGIQVFTRSVGGEGEPYSHDEE
ncbi:phosphodiesterase [Nisaea acidiphila]|uniref:Phosphodiesterase n=1 Tax=Nisaea acidiphila TaxID=1862145 RepID=A0A9J7B0G7_9PROT|nr:phosphodiesterase [Nisaea acidiphila]UUX51181.1 phosphodiesterase [Nisaea acidiphila]